MENAFSSYSFCSSSLLSTFLHSLQCNTTSNPHRWTVGGVYFQVCYGHLGIWRCGFLITMLVRINPNLIRQNEKWRGDGGNQELVYSCLGAVQNNSLNCPGSVFTSLRLLYSLRCFSLCLSVWMLILLIVICTKLFLASFHLFFDVLEPTTNWDD